VVLLSPATVRYQLKPYLMAVLAFEAVAMGVFVAVDLLVFFVFWELLLVPTFVLMKLWGTGPDRAAAGMRYVLYMLTGSAALLVGFCGGFTTFSTFSVETVGLIEGGEYGRAAAYSLLSFSLCLGATFAGVALLARPITVR